MGSLLYTHEKKDLERIVKFVVKELRKTELLSDDSVIPEEDKISQKEASELLCCSVATIINYKKRGLIPYFKVGRSIFYSKSELLAIAKKNKGLLRPARK